MDPEDIKRALILVISLLLVFIVFFSVFWRPKVASLKRYQIDFRDKTADLVRLEQDVKNWPAKFTPEAMEKYEGELNRLWELIPPEEEIAFLLEEIRTHAISAKLEIISFAGISNAKTTLSSTDGNAQYINVPYKISLSGSYFGLVEFLRRLEDSKRLVTVTSIEMYSGRGEHPMDAEIRFNIFYSEVEVKTG